MSTIISSSADELVVKAPSSVPADVKARAERIAQNVEKTLLDANERYLAAPKREVAETKFATLRWDIGMVGPIQLFPSATPPHDVNKVVASSEAVLVLAVSHGDSSTLPVPTNMYLAGKTCNVRFDMCNVSDCMAGPAPLFTFGPSVFSVSPIHIWGAIYTFPAPAGGSALYEANFSLDISTIGVPGAGFADWTSTVDSTSGLLVPMEAPGWKRTPYRFLVNSFPF